MDGFSGFKTATTEELPDAAPSIIPVMDPFHVVRLAGDALDRCGQRVQQDTLGHRGRAGDPLYKARRTLHTGAGLLTQKQTARINAVFAIDEHVEVEATWGIYLAHRRGLPRARQEESEADDASRDRRSQRRRPDRARRDPQARPRPQATRPRRARVL